MINFKELVGLKIKNNKGEEFIIKSCENEDDVDDVVMVLDNGKMYSVVQCCVNKIFDFGDELNNEINNLKNIKEEKVLNNIKDVVNNIGKNDSKKNLNLVNTEYENMDCIACFKGEYSFLSNMYPCKIIYKGKEFKSTEAAFQSEKCPERVSEFLNIDGYSSKRLGKTVKLRSDWDQVKLGIMRELVFIKFNSNPDLKNKLLETGDKMLVEGNVWNDRFWGICRGKGENNLGKILMEVREKLKISL